MFNIEYLSNYIEDKNKFKELANEIYSITSFIEKDYPNYYSWYYEKHIPGIIKGQRDTLFIKDKDNIIALSSIKNTPDEQKLCTIYVKEEYQNIGIGSILIDRSLQILNTDKPYTTLKEYKLEYFKNIINKYNWELSSKEDDELIYNKPKTKKRTK